MDKNIFSKQEVKKLWKPFVVLFVFSFLAMNWADVSWVFNYRIITSIATAPFQNIDAVDAEESGLSDLERASVAKEDKASGNKKEPKYAEIKRNKNKIEIPKIGISAPIVFTNSSNNQKYVYSVSRKIFLDKGEEIPENILTNNKNILISISCWPPGKDYKRIAVESVLID